jgi:hypothetical protein
MSGPSRLAGHPRAARSVYQPSPLPTDGVKLAALYLDECHNFLNLPGSLEDILSEARGYRLSLVLAHQHLDQLPREPADGGARCGSHQSLAAVLGGILLCRRDQKNA